VIFATTRAFLSCAIAFLNYNKRHWHQSSYGHWLLTTSLTLSIWVQTWKYLPIHTIPAGHTRGIPSLIWWKCCHVTGLILKLYALQELFSFKVGKWVPLDLSQSSTLAVVRWPTASENLFGPVTFANFFQ